MIEEDDLSVVFARNFNSLGAVARRVDVRVHIYHLSVSLVSEKEAFVVVGVDPEVWRVVECWVLRIPVEKAEIRRFWEQLLFAFKDVSEVFSLQPVGQVNVARYLIVALLLLANKDYGGHATAADILLPVSERRQKLRMVDFATSVT